jgi:hypothetical protein
MLMLWQACPYEFCKYGQSYGFVRRYTELCSLLEIESGMNGKTVPKVNEVILSRTKPLNFYIKKSSLTCPYLSNLTYAYASHTNSIRRRDITVKRLTVAAGNTLTIIL